MSATVRIPTILRTYTGGVGEVDADGSTLAEVLNSLEDSHPGIRARILDDAGALRRFVNVYVGDDDVRFIGGLMPRLPKAPRSRSFRRLPAEPTADASAIGY